MKLLYKGINNQFKNKKLYILLILFFFILCYSHSIILKAGIKNTLVNDKIEIKDGKVSGQLKGLERRSVLKIIAQKANIEIVGIENINGVIKNLELKNLSL